MKTRKRITLGDAISELRRELAMRKSVYPGLIATGKLKRGDANRQYLAMKFALDLLEETAASRSDMRSQGALFPNQNKQNEDIHR